MWSLVRREYGRSSWLPFANVGQQRLYTCQMYRKVRLKVVYDAEPSIHLDALFQCCVTDEQNGLGHWSRDHLEEGNFGQSPLIPPASRRTSVAWEVVLNLMFFFLRSQRLLRLGLSALIDLQLLPRLGRRAGQSNLPEDKSDDDPLESPISLSSGKSVSMQRPIVPPRSRKTGWGDELKSGKWVSSKLIQS